MRSICLFSLMTAAVFLAVPSAGRAGDGDVRLTVGVPAYVWHPRNRPGPEDWNQGWLRNEGVLADVSWPVHPMGARTNLRAGVTGGGFDNSLGDTAFFLGGMAEIETFAAPRWTLSLGTYAGAITGYDMSPAPAIAPYIGTSYAATKKIEIGARGYWLPAETIAGTELAPSDAYVAAFTVGTRF